MSLLVLRGLRHCPWFGGKLLQQVGMPPCASQGIEGFVVEYAGEKVVEVPLFLRDIPVVGERPCNGDERLLDDVVRFKPWEAFGHKRRHGRTIPRYELSPAGIVRTSCDVPKKGC